MPLTFLITNDDGVQAEGLAALREALRPLGRVITVAPKSDRSGVGHALTLDRPLRVKELGPDIFSIDGTPTDCVLAGLEGLLDVSIDLVLSGVNHGPNMGHDVHYSGTVAGAAEAVLRGTRGISVSLAAFRDRDFSVVGTWVPKLVEHIIDHDWPAETCLNVNLPNRAPHEVKGFRLARLGHRVYRDEIDRRRDPRGDQYFWIGGGEPDWTTAEGTDFSAVEAGYVSITPLNLDLTHCSALETLSGWGFDHA